MVLGAFSLGITFILLALIVWLLVESRRRQEASGLPAGIIRFSDTGAWFRNEESLFAADVRLAGKPDYLVEERNGMIVPVELKSGRAPEKPWPGHVYQLAAYCLLVEENYGVRPDYGIIQYADRAFAVDYSEELEQELLDLLMEMREDSFESAVDRDHQDGRRCRRCGVRTHCDQRLA